MLNKKNEKLQKLIVICGPTASGKTGLSLELARKFNGEIISADSRQIFKKMNIGTAKEAGEWRWDGLRRVLFINSIRHHLIDFLDPGKNFSAAEFRDKAIKYIKLVHSQGRVPFLVGGTGLYIQTVVDNLQIPRVLPNKKLRESLEAKTTEELFCWLKNLDEKASLAVDPYNKRRLIRALEVCILSGSPFSGQKMKGEQIFDVLQIAIDKSREELYNGINQRVEKQLALGLEKEVRDLVKRRYDWNLPSMSGIGYREFKDYFDDKCSYEELKENLQKDNRNYAKRQLTWFKRDKRIQWVKNYQEADKLVEKFLKR